NRRALQVESAASGSVAVELGDQPPRARAQDEIEGNCSERRVGQEYLTAAIDAYRIAAVATDRLAESLDGRVEDRVRVVDVDRSACNPTVAIGLERPGHCKKGAIRVRPGSREHVSAFEIALTKPSARRRG